MAKVQKQKLEQLTEDAVRVAGRAMSLLVMMRCPIRQEYEQVESFIQSVESIREELGLPTLTMEELVNGKPAERRRIGFELPEGVA
jgi:hypothetical protein